jgi:hypothetical protein
LANRFSVAQISTAFSLQKNFVSQAQAKNHQQTQAFCRPAFCSTRAGICAAELWLETNQSRHSRGSLERAQGSADATRGCDGLNFQPLEK